MLDPSQIPPEIVAVCRKLRDAGYSAYLVGGAVRDHLRLPAGEAQAKDFDIATSALPEQVIQLFGRRHTVPTGIQHGTVTVLVDRPQGRGAGHQHGHHEHVEVTTFRGEGAYSDGRRPDQVSFHDDLTEDLRRRDLTINAIAYDPLEDRLVDPFEGQLDIQRGLIRAVGDPASRFSEDGLRTMRAVRFAAQLGYRLDPATAQAIPLSLPTFRKVSWERIRDELLKILGSQRPALGLRLMSEAGLLAEVLPELAAAGEPLFEMVGRTRGDAVLRLGALISSLGPLGVPGNGREQEVRPVLERVVARLKLSAREQERLLAVLLLAPPPYDSSWTAEQVRRFLSATPAEVRQDLFELQRARLESEGRGAEIEAPSGLGELMRRVEEELRGRPALSIGELAIGGKEVMQLLGVPPGRVVGEVLRGLLGRVLADPTLNTPERLSALLPAVRAECG